MLQNELSRFALADPSLVATVSVARRYESKRLLHRTSALALLQSLQAEYAVVPSASKLIARYETLYFDTPNNDLYRDHHRGIAPRSKIRVRDYLDRGVSFLEVKTKQAEATSHKERRERAMGLEPLSFAELRFLSRVCPRTSTRGGALVPSLFTTFERVTLVRRDSAERVTLDLHPEFETAEGRVRFDDLMIVETKTQSAALPAAVRERGAVVGFSKYCLGRALLSESLPIQGIVSKLRRVTKVAGKGTLLAPLRDWGQMQSLGVVLG